MMEIREQDVRTLRKLAAEVKKEGLREAFLDELPHRYYDENLLHTLAQRMKGSRQIGEYKKAHNVAILQTNRWDSILSKMVEAGKKFDLSEEFVTEVFTAIHEASVQAQNETLSGSAEE